MAKTELIEAGFTYADLDTDTAGKLRCLANEINRLKEKLAGSALAIGERLVIAQEQLAKHSGGRFLQFIEFECGYSKSTAYNYMAAFKVFGSLPTVGRLEDSAMYALAQNGTPENALKEVLKLTDKGVKVTQKQAKEIIKKHTEPKDEQEVEEEEVEEEPEVVEEPTIDEICEEANKSIESFCRAIVKTFEKDVPRLPWTEDSGRIDSALASLKAGLTTLRGAKGEVCPACVEGRTEKGKCKYCKGHGYLPVYQAKGIPEDARL